MTMNSKNRINLSARFGARVANLACNAFVGLMALGVFAPTMAAAQSADPYVFEKKAFKTDGTPWVGPVNVGDTVKYVLSYKPGTANSGPATIVDTLSPNQSYAAPTTGPGWTWGSSPYSAANTETYINPGFGPGSGSVKLTVSGLPAPSSGDGDGTAPIPIVSLNKVFGVFHHAVDMTTPKYQMKIGCWNLSDLSLCSPSTVSNGGLFTPLWPQAVVRGSKFFFPGIQGGTITNGPVAIGCFDGSAGPSGAACGSTLVGVNAGLGQIGGVVEDSNGNLLIAVKERLYCFTQSGPTLTPCTAWPAGGFISASPAPVSPASWNTFTSQVYLLSDPTNVVGRVYVSHGSGVVQCVQTTGAPVLCSGWPATGVKPGGSSTGISLHSIPSGSAGDGGVCLWNIGGTLAGCLDANGAAVVSTAPASVVASVPIPFRFPNSAKVYFPSHNASQGPRCITYSGASGTNCAGFTSAVPTGFVNKTMQYGVAIDPSKPEKCMLALGDESLLWRFDYLTGEPGCGTTTVSTPPIDQLFCNGAPDPAKFQWSSVNVSTSGAAGTLTIKQGTSAPVSIALTSGATNYAMPAAITAGYGPLTFSFAPTGGSPASIDLVVGYTSDKNPEVCYQAKVTKCGPVFNDAVFKAAFNGAAVNSSKRVDLGEAQGPGCEIVKPPVDTASCLTGDPKVTCGKTPGTYVITLATNSNGPLAPDFVSLTPKTLGVTIINPQSTYPVIGGVVKVTVAGANPGDVIQFDMEGTIQGAGSVEGSDLCCNGPIKITIPADLNCADKKLVDLAIKKTGATSPAPQVNGYSFNMAVTNVGAPFNGTNAVTVTDVVPAGMTFTAATGTDWTCATLPAAAGSTLTCTYTGAGPVSAGQSMGSIAISATATGKDPFPPFTNCGVVGTLASASYADTNPTNNKSCVTVKKPDASTIKVTKVCLPVKEVIGAINSYLADCKITVTTTGPQTALIVVNEALTGGGTVTSAVSSSTPAWACTIANCSINGTLLNQTASTSEIDVKVSFPSKGHALESQNCAKLSVGQNPVPKPEGESCTKFTIVDEPKGPDVAINKVCGPVAQLDSPTGLSFGATCKITVTTTGPIQSQLVVKDVLSSGNGQVNSLVSTSVPAWACASLQCDMPGGNLNQTSSVSTFDAIVTFSPFAPPLAQNCAKLGIDAHVAGESCADIGQKPFNVSVAKDCSGIIALTANGPWAGSCKITVTTTGGPRPALIEFTDMLVDSNSSRNPPISFANFQSSDPWSCIASAPIGPLGCKIAGNAFPASGVSVIDVGVQVPIGVKAGEAKNCVRAFGGGDMQAVPLVSYVTTPDVCVPLPGGKDAPPPVDNRMYIKKVVVNNAPGSLAGLEYEITSQCTNTTQPSRFARFVDGQTILFDNYEAGLSCILSEIIPATTACGEGFYDIWTTNYSPSQTVVLSPNGVTITVTNTLNCERIDNPPPLVCDPATATNAGDLCRCRFDNMTPVSKTACECKQGYALKAGQGCLKKVVDPVCKKSERYQPERKRCEPVCAKGFDYSIKRNACIQQRPECKQGFEYSAKRNACIQLPPVCKKGTKLNPARGRCDPVCQKGFDYSSKRNTCIQQKPECKEGTVYNPKRNRCVAVQPVCKAPFTYDAKRNACVKRVEECPRGTISVKGRCIKIPKCPFGSIPVPGTGICVGIGGGGGGGTDTPKDVGRP